MCHMARKQLQKCHMSVVGNMTCHDTGNAVCQMSRKQLGECHMSVVGNMICHNRKCCVSDVQETAGGMSHVSRWKYDLPQQEMLCVRWPGNSLRNVTCQSLEI